MKKIIFVLGNFIARRKKLFIQGLAVVFLCFLSLLCLEHSIILVNEFGSFRYNPQYYFTVILKLFGLILGFLFILLYVFSPDKRGKISLFIKNKTFFLHSKFKDGLLIIKNFLSFKISQFQALPLRKKQILTLSYLVIFILICIIIKNISFFAPPQIMTTFPGKDASESSLDTKIEIIFSRDMNKPSVEKSLTVMTNDITIKNPWLRGSFSWEGNQKIIFTPATPLNRASKYTVSFKTPILAGNFIPMIANGQFTFETLGNPKVVLKAPEGEAVETSPAITVIFDRPMIALTTATNSAIKKPAFTIDPPLTGKGRWLGTTSYQFRPTGPVKQASTYTVSLFPNLKSQDGGVIKDEYSWQFSTPRPKVREVTPVNSEKFANPEASVSAVFTQNMDPESVKTSFKVYNDFDKEISGRVIVNGSVAGFYPNNPLTREKHFTAVIKQFVKSLEGPNGMENEHRWSFSTAAYPEVTGSSPKDKAKDVKNQNTAIVYFKSPMDAESFAAKVTIDPKPDQKPSFYTGIDYAGRPMLSIGSYFTPSSNYKITINSGVKDQYGVPLQNPFTFSFSTAPYEAGINIVPYGTYFATFNQEITSRLVTQVVNASRVDYSLYKLKRDDFLRLYRMRYEDECGNYNDPCRQWQNYNPEKLEKVNTWSEKFDKDLNIPTNVITKVTQKDGSNLPPGIYFVEVKIPSGKHDNLVMIVSKSTLTAKKGQQQILVWAVDQSSAEVIPDMNLEITDSRGNSLLQGKTNNDGVYQEKLDMQNENALFIFGQKDSDATVLLNTWSTGIDSYQFGLPYYNYYYSYNTDWSNQYKLFITLDRPLYRPGQTLLFKGVIRKDNDSAYSAVTPDTKVSVSVKDSRGKSIFNKSLPVNTFGSFSGDFKIGSDVSLGQYTINASFNNNQGNQIFQVEEYKRPDLFMTVTSGKDSYLSGETAEVTLNAAYYFGAPVSFTALNWTKDMYSYSFRYSKDQRFEFGDSEDYWRNWWSSNTKDTEGEKKAEGKTVTDAKGNATLSFPVNIDDKKNSQTVTVEGLLQDQSNQSAWASGQFIVHKSSLYVGVKPEKYANTAGKEAGIEVIVVDPEEKEIKDQPVSLDIYKRIWETVRELNEDDGQFYYVSKNKDTLVKSLSVKTNDLGRSVTSFTPEEGGTYKVLAKVTDTAGRTNESSAFLWVSGFGFVASRENHDRIVLITDKKDYTVGEDLSLFIATPFASASAKTLLTAERGDVIDYKIVNTSDASNNFTLPVLPKYTPNVYLSAVLVKGGSKVKDPPEFKIGYAEIKVTDKKNQVNLKLSTDKKRYKPGDTAKVTLEAKDLLGHPLESEINLSLVDKALLDLSQITLPEIYSYFYQPRSLSVSNAQLLTLSMDRINANTDLGAKGGSGGCFTGDTEILMAGSYHKKIKDVKVGDLVLTKKSPDSTILVPAKVTRVYIHKVNNYLLVNNFLEVTSVHRLYVNNEWQIAGLLKVGDTLLDKNNHPYLVNSISQISMPTTVYNLEIENYHTYFANDLYVHNQKGDMGPETTRKNFPETAYWNPHVYTDKNGKAEVQIKLPDNLTTWHLSAAVNNKDTAFGSSSEDFIVSRDVLLRPFTPRFLSIGDNSKLGAIIVNTSGSTQNVTAAIEVEGLSIKDDNTKQLSVSDGAQVKVTWDTITQNVTSAKIKLSVKSPDFSDSMELTLLVKSYSIPETVATSGKVNGTAMEKIVFPKDLDSTQGLADIALSPSLGAGAFTSLPYLFSYPYRCIEQTVSILIPSIYGHRILHAVGVDKLGAFDKKMLVTEIEDGLQRLNKEQKSDGGWGWWMEYESDPFLTAYAYEALTEAKIEGFSVASSTIDRTRDFLQRRLSTSPGPNSYYLDAYILYVLRNEKEDFSSYAGVLYDHRFEMGIIGRMHLAIAMKNMPSLGNKAQRIVSEVTGMMKKTATGTHWEEKNSWYGGVAGVTASVLEALTVYNKNNPLIPEAARYLYNQQKDSYWKTTYDTSRVVKTMALLMLSQGDEKIYYDYKVDLNKKTIKTGKFAKEDLLKFEELLIPIKNLFLTKENILTFSKSGTGNLYYNLNLKYYLPFSEIVPLEQGMVIEREFIDDQGNELGKKVVNEGSDFWVRLTVAVPEVRQHVIIEDPLPAGLESINESLKSTRALSKEKPPHSKETQKNNPYGYYWSYFSHHEYRDDRTAVFAEYLPPGVYEFTYRVRATTPGIYHYPPAQVYEMYFPDVSGHSDGGFLEVKPQT